MDFYDVFVASEFAEVVLNLPVRRGFHYLIPKELQGRVVPGARVAVPFGPRKTEGTCVRLHPKSPVEKVRAVEGVVAEVPPVPDALLELTRWMADRYLASWGQALACAMPQSVHRRAGGTRRVLEARRTKKRGRPKGKGAAVLTALIGAGGAMRAPELERAGGVGRSVLKRLEREGWLTLEKVEVEVDLPEADLFSEEEPERLTVHQKKALAEIEPALDPPRHRVFLLEGVTASGKTELYIRAIRNVLAQGRQALLLMPEISLTAQMFGRIRSRLGPVGLMHSRMTAGARARQWREAAAGRIPIVMGARSAVFTPVKRLGLIVIDEEHDSSYKEHSAPRYHAREVAIERARRAGVPVILGSATPAIESMYGAREGGATHLHLPERIGGRAMPKVEIISLAEERVQTRRASLLSRRLREETQRAVDEGHQVILYLNRRGYTTSIRCPRCAWLMRCRRCAVVLTYHRQRGETLCHYCMKAYALPDRCPDCRKAAPVQSGAGTEKVEDEVRARIKGATVLRMDSDSMKSRHLFHEALRKFRDGAAQIMVGTRMIAKGFHFPNVTLVGVINADTAFHLPDFRSAETTFQDLTHVTGRPGRGDHPGLVLIQTYQPTHYSVTSAATHDYAGFYTKELAMRREYGYPPFGALVRLVFEGREEAAVERSARQFTDALREMPGITILGPSPAPRYRLRNRYRVHALVKSTDATAARRAVGTLMDRRPLRGAVDLAVDVDPYESM